MQIIQITNDFPPLIGGMAAHAWELSKALVRCGHSVTVLTGAKVLHDRSRLALTKREIVDGVQVINLGFSLLRRRYYKYSFTRATKKFLSQMRSESIEVVLHIHEHMRQQDIRELTDLPLIWTNHSSMFLDSFEVDSKKPDLAHMVHRCDWITAPSRELCVKTIELGYPANRVTYIPNGVDINRFRGKIQQAGNRVLNLNGKIISFPRDACVVLCARRFVYKNGLHFYLDALESIAPAVLSQCVFIFAGNKPEADGGYRREISRRIDALSRMTVVHLLGPVPNKLMPEVYRVADISVLPSFKEATSITALESMATGLPIVGTDVGGIPEIVEHGANGLLCGPSDVASLAKNLVTLIGNSKLRCEMGAAGRRLAKQRFSWDHIAEQFLDVYRNALALRIDKQVTS